MHLSSERAIQDCYFEGFYIVIASRVTEVQSFEFSLPHIDTLLLILVETVFIFHTGTSLVIKRNCQI